MSSKSWSECKLPIPGTKRKYFPLTTVSTNLTALLLIIAVNGRNVTNRMWMVDAAAVQNRMKIMMEMTSSLIKNQKVRKRSRTIRKTKQTKKGNQSSKKKKWIHQNHGLLLEENMDQTDLISSTFRSPKKSKRPKQIRRARRNASYYQFEKEKNKKLTVHVPMQPRLFKGFDWRNIDSKTRTQCLRQREQKPCVNDATSSNDYSNDRSQAAILHE